MHLSHLLGMVEAMLASFAKLPAALVTVHSLPKQARSNWEPLQHQLPMWRLGCSSMGFECGLTTLRIRWIQCLPSFVVIVVAMLWAVVPAAVPAVVPEKAAALACVQAQAPAAMLAVGPEKAAALASVQAQVPFDMVQLLEESQKIA